MDRMAVMGLAFVLLACGSQATATPTPGASFAGGETSPDVIVGVDADRVIITEPWVDVLADGGTATATLNIVPPSGEVPMVLGIEGAIYFVRSTDADGELILDAIVGHEGGPLEIPAGGQTLTAYYRTCDGSCSLLGEAQDFCATQAEVVEGARYELTVEVHGLHRAVPATCTLEEAHN
jgi:hypothetical protein